MNLFIFNCLTSNFCFPENIFFASRREQEDKKEEENGYLWTRILSSDFKLTQENDDLLSLKHKEVVEVVHPVLEYTKV